MSKEYLNWFGEPLQPKKMKFINAISYCNYERFDDGCELMCSNKACNGGFINSKNVIICGRKYMEFESCVITV